MLKRERFIVIVGLAAITVIARLTLDDAKILPMMWETSKADSQGPHLFDFKYLLGRNILGLTRPAIFSREDLRKLFDLYCQKTGELTFR